MNNNQARFSSFIIITTINPSSPPLSFVKTPIAGCCVGRLKIAPHPPPLPSNEDGTEDGGGGGRVEITN